MATKRGTAPRRRVEATPRLEVWAVVDSDGEQWGPYLTEAHARVVADNQDGGRVVHLTEEREREVGGERWEVRWSGDGHDGEYRLPRKRVYLSDQSDMARRHARFLRNGESGTTVYDVRLVHVTTYRPVRGAATTAAKGGK